jgi:hypothetical protein
MESYETEYHFFITNNRNGKKSRENWLKNHETILYEKIINWCNQYEDIKNLPFVQKIYHYLIKSPYLPECVECENIPTFTSFQNGYSAVCGKECQYKSILLKQRWKSSIITNNSFVGIHEKRAAGYNSIKEYNEYLSELQKEIYIRDGNKFETEEFKIKRKQILLEKYNDPNYNNKQKTKETRIKNGNQISDVDINDFLSYKTVVNNRTNTIYRCNESIINPLELKNSVFGYHIDHKYSIHQGYINNVPLSIITHPANLEMLWYKDNLSKKSKCSITLEQLLIDIINYDKEVKVVQENIQEEYAKTKETAKEILNKIIQANH